MLETAFTAFATFFATIGPVEAAALFATFTARFPRSEQAAIALKATSIATLIILFFALFGQPILGALGVGLAALQAAGGVILLLIALDMVFARHGGSVSLSRPESVEAVHRDEIAVFPLATPLLAGPGAMSGAILLMANAHGDVLLQGAVIAALLAVMLIALLLLLAAQQLNILLGVTAQRVIMRVLGILLAALAMQSLFNGIAASGLFARPL